MTETTTRNLLVFLNLSAKLKDELRHSWTSTGRQESVAEHTWQMAIMALLLHSHLDKNNEVDLMKVLKMVLIHDLPEAIVGDLPCFQTDVSKQQKYENEYAAVNQLRSMLENNEFGNEIHNLWMEFEEGETPESKFAKALDNLEVQIQHNMAPLDTWEPVEYELAMTKMDPFCSYDPFLERLCSGVKKDAVDKIGNPPRSHAER